MVALGWKMEGLLFDGLYINFETSDMISIVLYKSILGGVGVEGDCVIPNSEMVSKDIARMELGSL